MMALGRVASPTSALAACSPPPPERWERAPGAVCSTFLSVRPGFACPDYGPWCVRGLSRHEIKRTAAARGVRPFRAPRMLFTWFLFSNPIHMGRGRGLRGAAALTFSIHLPSCVLLARRTSTSLCPYSPVRPKSHDPTDTATDAGTQVAACSVLWCADATPGGRTSRRIGRSALV